MSPEKLAKYYLRTKYNAELFSKDPDRKVGALFLHRVSLATLSEGYNGIPRQVAETAERWQRPMKDLFVAHAERNGIDNACWHGTPLHDAMCFVTRFPCHGCAGSLINVGAGEIIAPAPILDHPRWGRSFRASLEMLLDVRMPIIIVNDDDGVPTGIDPSSFLLRSRA